MPGGAAARRGFGSRRDADGGGPSVPSRGARPLPVRTAALRGLGRRLLGPEPEGRALAAAGARRVTAPGRARPEPAGGGALRGGRAGGGDPRAAPRGATPP